MAEKKKPVSTRAAEALLRDEPLRNDAADVLFDVAITGIQRAEKNRANARLPRRRKKSTVPCDEELLRMWEAMLPRKAGATEKQKMSAAVRQISLHYPDAELSSIGRALRRAIERQQKKRT